MNDGTVVLAWVWNGFKIKKYVDDVHERSWLQTVLDGVPVRVPIDDDEWQDAAERRLKQRIRAFLEQGGARELVVEAGAEEAETAPEVKEFGAALDIVCRFLHDDDDTRRAYEANIAMRLYDIQGVGEHVDMRRTTTRETMARGVMELLFPAPLPSAEEEEEKE